MWRRSVVAVFAAGSVFALAAQTQEQAAQEKTQASSGQPEGWRQLDGGNSAAFTVEPGTRIPLSLINSVSTKHSSEGDRVYLQTAFPILVKGRLVIPPGSYVAGTITEVKRPGRLKGRGELYLRFDSLTLPNGVTRDFRARIGALDGRTSEELDRSEGKIKSEGNKAGDAQTVGEAAAAGASIGVIAGGATGHYGMGAAIGAGAGAMAGLMGVLLSRGPDAVLSRGSTIEMVLDRPVSFDPGELDFSHSMTSVPVTDSGAPASGQQRRGVPIPGRRWPF